MTTNTDTVLHPVLHQRLIADIEAVAAKAVIPVQALRKSVNGILGDEEMAWLKSLRRSPTSQRLEGKGLILTGGLMDAEEHLTAIVAALLRNFVDARMVPFNSLLELTDQVTVVAVPNLYISGIGSSVQSWRVEKIYEVLISRLSGGLLTLAYVEDMGGLTKHYGGVFARHLKKNYEIVGS